VCGSRGRGDSSNKVRGILKDISHWRIELSLVLNEDWHFTKPLNVLATELSQPSTLSYLLGGAEKRYITYIRSSIFLPLKEHSEGRKEGKGKFRTKQMISEGLVLVFIDHTHPHS